MTDFLNTIKLKAEGLKNMDGKMDDDEIVITILRKFPRSLSYAAAAIRHETGEGKRDLDEVIECLIDEAAIIESSRRGQHHGRDRTDGKDNDN